MKNRPIHENLDTSFVNLSALLRYLRRRQFVGKVRVELSGYEADVILTAENQLKVLEHDRVAGRISEGEEALQRLLIRAREPGGIIHVYQTVEENALSSKASEPIIKVKPFAAEVRQMIAEITAKPLHQNGNSKTLKTQTPTVEEDLPPPDLNLPKFPFESKNDFEVKARQKNLAPSDWETLLNLTAELLQTVDRTLAEANLDFAAAFEKARSEIAGDYPFLSPSSNVFDYKSGKIIMREKTSAKLFAASIIETLRRILEKLSRNPKFANIYRITTQNIRTLIERRRPLYDKFSITPALEKIIRAG